MAACRFPAAERLNFASKKWINSVGQCSRCKWDSGRPPELQNGGPPPGGSRSPEMMLENQYDDPEYEMRRSPYDSFGYYSDLTSERSGSPGAYDRSFDPEDGSSFGSPYDEDGFMTPPPPPRSRRPLPPSRGRRPPPRGYYYEDDDYEDSGRGRSQQRFHPEDYYEDYDDFPGYNQRARAGGRRQQMYYRDYADEDELQVDARPPRRVVREVPRRVYAVDRIASFDDADLGISSLYDEGDDSEPQSSSPAQSEMSVDEAPSAAAAATAASSESSKQKKPQFFPPSQRSLRFRVKDKSRWVLDPDDGRAYDFDTGGLVVGKSRKDRPASVSFRYRPFQPAVSERFQSPPRRPRSAQ